jgi:hypothetical protein
VLSGYQRIERREFMSSTLKNVALGMVIVLTIQLVAVAVA